MENNVMNNQSVAGEHDTEGRITIFAIRAGNR